MSDTPEDDASEPTKTPKKATKKASKKAAKAPKKPRIRLKKVTPTPPRKKIRLVKKHQPNTDETSDTVASDKSTVDSDEEEVLFDGTFEDEIDPANPDEGMRKMVGAIAEKLVPKLIKRIVSAGGEKLTETDLRQIIRETPLPRDVAGLMGGQIGHLREEILRILTQEIQKFLGTLNISQELQKLLTSVSFEIRTEIRFIPNDKSTVKPNIKNRVKVRRTSKSEE